MVTCFLAVKKVLVFDWIAGYGQVNLLLSGATLLGLVKQAGNSFQHFSNGYTLKGEYCHCLTSDATIMVSYKFPIIG